MRKINKDALNLLNDEYKNSKKDLLKDNMKKELNLKYMMYILMSVYSVH